MSLFFKERKACIVVFLWNHNLHSYSRLCYLLDTTQHRRLLRRKADENSTESTCNFWKYCTMSPDKQIRTNTIFIFIVRSKKQHQKWIL